MINKLKKIIDNKNKVDLILKYSVMFNLLTGILTWISVEFQLGIWIQITSLVLMIVISSVSSMFSARGWIFSPLQKETPDKAILIGVSTLLACVVLYVTGISIGMAIMLILESFILI